MNAIALCVLMIGQAPPTADESRLLKQIDEFRTRRLAEYDATIEKATNSRSRSKLKNARKEFEKTGVIETLYPTDFVTGRIGYLSGGYANASNRYAPDNSFRVSQVIDPLSMIVESPDDYTGRTLDNFARNLKSVRFFVYGVSTKDVIDKSFVRLPQLFEVIGTKTYTTVIGGSSTIYEIRPFPIQDIESFLKP